MSRRAGPLAEQLAQHLRDRILRGEPRGGERLSELSVSTEYGVARPTAKAALDILVGEGLVSREPYAALRVTTVEPAEMPEILALLDVVERLAVDRILRDGPDLRALRDVARSSPERVLEEMVEVAASSRLSRTHRQATLELALAIGRRSPVAPADAALKSHAETLTESLFLLQEDEAVTALGSLQELRRAACGNPASPRFLRLRSAWARAVTDTGSSR